MDRMIGSIVVIGQIVDLGMAVVARSNAVIRSGRQYLF